MASSRTAEAMDLMLRFAERTGLTSSKTPKRYLWTDAFAVCNFLILDRQELAVKLVAQVHSTLGWHRVDDRRTGRLSGLDDVEGEAHPTRGGLRIGKPRPERAPGEPQDERLEWEQDGQYFHYLTRWMHALDRLTRATGDSRYTTWARELMETAHRAFVVRSQRRMYWKMSVDLSQPLVKSMGHHDPLDGLVTCLQLEDTAERLGQDATAVAGARHDFEAMVDRRGLATSDALGIGGLLTDACRLDQLQHHRDLELRDELCRAALAGVRQVAASRQLEVSAGHRLAFRELGLAIGLAAAERLLQQEKPPPATQQLKGYAFLRNAIESFWLRAESRLAETWLEHLDINEVMLATSLVPDGYLVLGWHQ